ncbi:ISAs1 family transposase [Streptomyces longisporoflavus]|uniref:ISAs1 family transposase n=1 Tax=Streptomyces longisporoflavus TaxID=28044 RepID=A0ABW7R5C8_9ACTN
MDDLGRVRGRERQDPVTGWRAIAVDGKTLRGSRTKDRPATTLIAAMPHGGQVLAQREVDGKSNEIPVFAAFLDNIDLTGTVITADALHTQHDHASCLHQSGAPCLAVAKKNHPGLHDKVRRLPRRDIRLDHYERSRAHQRHKIRRLKTPRSRTPTTPTPAKPFKSSARRDPATGKLTIERIYLATNLPPGAATGAELAVRVREHWRTENQLHHVRDRTFHKEASKIRTRHLPRVMAGLRNLAIGVHRQDGHTNITAALRRNFVSRLDDHRKCGGQPQRSDRGHLTPG